MKHLQATKVWVLICSTLAITGATPSCNGFQTPCIKASTTPWWTNPQNSPIITSNQNKESNPELTCISTNQNIFNIVEESKAHCKGQDYRVTFYLQTDDDYTKLDSFLIDKHLFHNLLMKYSDWSLTSEKVGSINKEQAIKDDDELNYGDNLHDDNLNEHSKDPLTGSGQTKWPIIVRLVEKDKMIRQKDRICVCDGFEHQDTTNTHSNINNEKDNNYHMINPSYNSKYKFYEVAVPEYIDTSSSPKTIDVYIDKNIKNDEYDIKVVEENKSCTEDRKKSEPEDQNASLKDFVKNHKISEIIDILFNDENVSYNKPILFDCNGTDTDIVNSDVKHIYSTGDSAEYHEDINGYLKNIDIGETILNSGNNKACNREPNTVEIFNSTNNNNNEYVITDTADSTVDSSAVRNNTGVVNNYYYSSPNDESFQPTESIDEKTIPIINTGYSVNVNPTVLSAPLDEITITQTSKEPNSLILPLTETENTESTEYIPCEYDDKKPSDSNIQDPSFTPNYQVHSQESTLFLEDLNNNSPDNSNIIQKPTKPSCSKALLDTENQKPFYTIDEIPFLANPEDYPVTPQIVYSEPIPTDDTEFYINAKISEAPGISSDLDTETFHIINHNIIQEEFKKPLSNNEIIPTVVHDLEMPISELSQKPQSVPNIPSTFRFEPLTDNQISKTMKLLPMTQISPIPKIAPKYETPDITPFSLSTSTCSSTDKTPSLKPFIKMSQLSIPQEDASVATITSFPQSDIISHLPEIIEINEPAVLTLITPAVSPLPERNTNIKVPTTISSYRTPFLPLKTSKPLSVSPVIPTISKPFSSFYSCNSQNMLPMPAAGWLPPIFNLRKYKSSTKSTTPKSHIPISTSTVEAIPEVVPVQTPTIPTTSPNLQPKFNPFSLANSQNKIYSEVPNASPITSPISSKELFTIYPLTVNQMKPDHVQEPYVESWSTAPIQTNLFPKLSLPPVTPLISLLPLRTPTVTVSPLKYKNQIAKDIFENTASPTPHKLLLTQKYRQPTLSPISSVPTPASKTSFHTSSPFTLAPSTLWQYFPEIQHLHSKPAETIKPLLSPTPILPSDSNIQDPLPLPEVGTVASCTQSPMYTKQLTTTSITPIEKKPKTHIKKLNNYEPSFQKLHYHIPSSIDFLPPITQDYTKSSHPITQSTKSSPIDEPIPISNILSNAMTYIQQPTKPYVEPTIANHWTKASLRNSPSLKAVSLFDKTFPFISPSSVLEPPPISTYTSQLPETAISLSSTYPRLKTSYANKLNPILSYTDVKNLFQAKPSTASMMPPKANVTPFLSKQGFNSPRLSLSYSENLVDKQSSLDSSFVPISSSLSTPSLKSTMNDKPIEIIPKSYNQPISALPVPVKDILQLKGATNTPLQIPLPILTDSLTTPCVYPVHECWQLPQPNLLKTYSHYTTPSKVKESFPLVLPSTTTAQTTAFQALYTSPTLIECNQQSKSPIRWSESLPICNEPQKYKPQPITLDNLSASPVLAKEEPLSSDMTTHIPSPAINPIYPTSFLRTPNKISCSPLMYPAKKNTTLAYAYQAHPSLLSPIPIADTKTEGVVTHKLTELPHFVTPLYFASKPVPKIFPNILLNKNVDFKEILPCKFGEYSIPLSPVTYYSPSEKIPKATPVCITPNLVPNKIYPLPSPVKTKTEPVIPLTNNNIPIETDIQGILSSGFPSYATPLLKPSSFLDKVSTAFSTLPLEESKPSITPPSSLIREGKLLSGQKPSDFTSPLLRLKYGPQLIQETVHGIPLSPLTLPSSTFLQSKEIVSSQQFPCLQIEDAPCSSVHFKPSTPIYASSLLEPIPGGLKPLKLNNTDLPKWRWSETSSSSPITPTGHITPLPLPSDVIASGLINALGASPYDRISKPHSQSYVSTYKPVYTVSQNLSDTLSSPIITALADKCLKPKFQASDRNKINYAPLNDNSKSVFELLPPASYKSDNIPQIISPLQLSEIINKPMKVLYSNYPQSSILNKYKPNFYKLPSQSETPCPIDANVPSLLPISATPSTLPYRRPQISKSCQWSLPTTMPSITPTFATTDPYTQLPSTSHLSKGTKTSEELLYYPISSILSPATLTSSASSILRTQNIAPSSSILSYTQIGEPLKAMPCPSWYTSYYGYLKTPAIPLTVYPTSTLSYPKLKPPNSNSNLVSYLPVAVSGETLKPQLTAPQFPVNALESIIPVKLLPASQYKWPCFHQTPLSPSSPVFTPVLNPVQSPFLKASTYTTPLKYSDLIYLPSPKLPTSIPIQPFAPITPGSLLKETSELIRPLQNAYPLQSISNSLTKALPLSIKPMPASHFRQISSPILSELSPCKYAASNFPKHISHLTVPLNTLQYAAPSIYDHLSEQKFNEYKPTPYSVIDTSNPIPSFIEFSSVASTKPSLLDSVVTSSMITAQAPLLQTVSPESSLNLSAKPLFIKPLLYDTIPIQYVPSKIPNSTPNSPTTYQVPPVRSSYSVISNANLLIPPSSSISSLLPIVNTPILPESMKSELLRNPYVMPIASPTYVNAPVISQRRPLPKFVSSTPSIQSICSSPLSSEIGTAIPILPTVPSVPVETILPKETHNIRSETPVNPQILIPPVVAQVSSYLPIPISSSQTTPGRYTYATPYVPVVSSPMRSSVTYAPLRISDPYLRSNDQQFNTMYSTPQNVKPSPKSFTKYLSPIKYQSYYPSICPIHFTKSSPNSQSQLPLVTQLLSTPKLSPYKYTFPIKYGQFGLIYPAPQSKPCTNVPVPIYSDKLASPTTITHNKPFTNYMPTYSIATSFKPAMSTMSSPPAVYPSEISAVPTKTVLPSVTSTEMPYDFTEYVTPKSSLPTIKVKCDNNFITAVDSSLNKILSTSSPQLFLSKLSPSMRSQLTYPQSLPIKTPVVLSKYISPPVTLSPLKQFSYYPSSYTITNPKKSFNIFPYSNKPLSEFKSPQSTSTYLTPLSSNVIPASTLPITPNNSLITSQNTNYYTPLKPFMSNIIPTPTESRIAFNSKPYLNMGLNSAEISSSIINTQYLPHTCSEYMTPESASLKPATNVVSPVPKLMSRLLQSLSYPQTRSSETHTPPEQYVTPVSTPVSSTLYPSLQSSSLTKPIYSKISTSQYSPVETPVSNHPLHMIAETAHTPTCNYENELSTSSPLSVASPYASVPAIQPSQFSPYSSLSSNHRNILLTYPKYRILYPKPVNTTAKDLSFQNSQFIQPYYTPLSSKGKKSSSPLEPVQFIQSLSTSSPRIPTISASSSNLSNHNTFQLLFKPNSPVEAVSGTFFPPNLTNQFIYDTSSLKSFKSKTDNLNINKSIDTTPYYYYPTIYKTNLKSPLYNTATYSSLYSDPTSIVSKQPTSHSNYFNDSLFKTYPIQPEDVFGKSISPSLQNQYYDNNLRTVSITNNFMPLQNEMKSRLYNYIKNNNNIKADVHNSMVDLSIPLGNILVAKKDCDDPMVHTISPSIGLQIWPSNFKLLEAKLELKFKDIPVTNFQPVVNNLATQDLDEVVNLIKSYIRNKYGEVIVLDNGNNEYKVINHCSNEKNKCNLLWPVDTSCHSVKGFL